MSKNKGQGSSRAMRRGNIDEMGNSLRRPFNNRKRTKGREPQLSGEKYYKYLKEKFELIRKEAQENEDIKNSNT